MSQRLAIVARTRAELGNALMAAARGEVPAGAQRGEVIVKRAKRAWLFTGQGAQRAGMGKELYERWPVFRRAMDEVCGELDRYLERPLREVMWAQEGSEQAKQLDQTVYTQAGMFALQWALAQLWQSWGVRAERVVGHSIGELAGACVAGVMTMKEGARLVAARGRLMQGLPAGGEMMTVGAGEREVEEELEGYQGKVVIAAVNAEDAVVIAGEKEEVREVGERLEKKGIRVKRLEVSHAFHSARMEPMMEEYRREAEKIEYGKKKIPMVSTVSGREAGEEVETAEYWVRQVREAVRFWEATKTLKREGVEEYLEVGPRGVLVGLIRESGGEAEPVRLASMRSGRGENEAMLEALGGYYVGGGEVEWKGVMGGEGKRIELPTYPWQRQRYWMEGGERAEVKLGEGGRWGLSGVGVKMPGANEHHVLRVGKKRQEYLGEIGRAHV